MSRSEIDLTPRPPNIKFMSTWYEPKIEDIEYIAAKRKSDKDEFHIWIDSDYGGHIWVSLNVDDIKELINKYEDN